MPNRPIIWEGVTLYEAIFSAFENMPDTCTLGQLVEKLRQPDPELLAYWQKEEPRRPEFEAVCANGIDVLAPCWLTNRASQFPHEMATTWYNTTSILGNMIYNLFPAITVEDDSPVPTYEGLVDNGLLTWALVPNRSLEERSLDFFQWFTGLDALTVRDYKQWLNGHPYFWKQRIQECLCDL